MTNMLNFVFLLAAVFSAANGTPWQWRPDVSIVGGDEVDITEYPYQIRMLVDGWAWCGGSIISEEYILTAAHCIEDLDPKRVSVRIGSTYSDKGGQVFKVKKTYVHPKWSKTPVMQAYDFGVMQTAEKMPINNETTRIVKMADAGSSLNPGDIIVVTGWGAIREDGPSSEVLRAVEVPVISLESCQKAYGPENVSESMLCAGVPEGGKDACQGDSGGAAVSANDFVQYGVVSWGFGCAREEYPGVYSLVPAARDWIREVSGV